MLFSRRNPETFFERVRLCLWPRRSFLRSLKYLAKRVVRISATPHAVALGLAIGIYFACSPFIGFHILMTIAVAWFFRANIAAAVLGTAFANPLTIPFLIGLDYEVGHFFLALFGKSEALPISEIMKLLGERNFLDKQTFIDLWQPIVEPLLLGSLVIGGVAAVLAYILAFWATARFRRLRREKLSRKVKLRLQHDNV